MFGDRFWTILVIAGPIILGLAMVWAMRRNKTSDRQYERTEQATRDLYDREARDERENTTR